MTRLLLLLAVLLMTTPAHATIDAVANGAFGTLTTGYASGATSIIATTGVGAKFPNSPYNISWWNCTDYAAPHLDPLTEFVRVISRTGDTFTITRAQEGTTANDHNIVGKTYCIAQLWSKYMVDSVRTDIANSGGAITDVADAQNYANLDTAITQLCATTAIKTLRISNLQTLSTSLTVCPNVTVWIIGSGQISINNTVVLTINAPVVAPVRTIFIGLGTVSGLTFSRGEWFGAVRDGSSDDTAALQKAISAISSVGGQLNLGVGTYRVTSSLLVGNYVQIEGFGPAATFIRAGLSSSVVRPANTGAKTALWHFKYFTFDNTARTNVGGICLNMTNVDDSIIENVYVQNCETGLLMLGSGSGISANNNVLRNLDCFTATTCYKIQKAEWINAYDLRSNNGVTCIDLDDNTYVALFGPKCEAFSNGIRVGSSVATTHTKLYSPFFKNAPTVGAGITIGSTSTRTFTFQPFYSGLTSNYSDASADAIIWDAGFINGLRGISEGNVTASDLNGTCTFASSTTCPVTFTNAMPDTSYKIQVSCGTVNKTFGWTTKTTLGFNVLASVASSDTCDWWVSR
jgi:hypothetical protein